MMKGLLYKDIKSIVKTISPAYLMCLIPIFVFWGKNDFLFITTIVIGVFLAMQVLVSISIDEKSRLTVYYRTLPLSYIAIAIEKYILMLFMMILTMIISFVVTFLYTNSFAYMYPLSGAFIVFIYNIIMIPASLCLGVEKGRYFILIFTVLPLITANYTFQKVVKWILLLLNSKTTVPIFLFMNAILLLISLFISIKGVRRYIV